MTIQLHHFHSPFAAYAQVRRLVGFVDDENQIYLKQFV